MNSYPFGAEGSVRAVRVTWQPASLTLVVTLAARSESRRGVLSCIHPLNPHKEMMSSLHVALLGLRSTSFQSMLLSYNNSFFHNAFSFLFWRRRYEHFHHSA